MSSCNACGNTGAKYRIKNPKTGGFHTEKFCKKCRDRMVTELRRSGGTMELRVLMKNLYGGPTPVEGRNPEKPGSKARFDRHRQVPPQCFHTGSYKTVPLTHTAYPKDGPYNVPGALAVTSRIKAPCAAKYAERGIRVRYRQWAIQSILTPKSAGLRPTGSEMALENPTVIYTVPVNNVNKYGRPFWSMRDWHHENIGPYPPMREVFKKMKNPSMGQEDVTKLKMFEKERAEHPTLSDEAVWQIVDDHMKAGHNPADYEVVSEGPAVVGFGGTPVYTVTVKTGKGVTTKDIVVDVANYAYGKGWGGTPTVSKIGNIMKFTFKESFGPNPADWRTKENWAVALVQTGPPRLVIQTFHSKTKGEAERTKRAYGGRGVISKVYSGKRYDAVEGPYRAGPIMTEAGWSVPEANRHYTAKQRRAITSSPEFKAWVKTRTKAGFKAPKQGAFHAFMTDVGKAAVKRPLKGWQRDPTRADLKGEDVPSMKKHYYALGKNPKLEMPVFLHYEGKRYAVPKMEGYEDMNGYILKIGPKGGWRWEHPTEKGRYIPHDNKMVSSRGEGVVVLQNQTPELRAFLLKKIEEKTKAGPSKNPVLGDDMPGDKFNW